MTYRDDRTQTRFEYEPAKWAISASRGPHIIRNASLVVIDERSGQKTPVALTGCETSHLTEEQFREGCAAILRERFLVHEHLWTCRIGDELVMRVEAPAPVEDDPGLAIAHHIRSGVLGD